MPLFMVNGANVPSLTVDPGQAIWSDEGPRNWTMSGKLRSLAISKIDVRWLDAITFANYKALLDFYYALAPAGVPITSIVAPGERGQSTWQTYTQIDSRGILPDKPVGTMDGPLVFNVVWTLRRVKKAES